MAKSTVQKDGIDEAIDRIVDYLYEKTDITFIGFIQAKMVYDYIKVYEDCVLQAVNDMKILLRILKHSGSNPPEVDLSVNNYEFWLSVQEHMEAGKDMQN